MTSPPTLFFRFRIKPYFPYRIFQEFTVCSPEIGTHDQLLENKGLYYAMWRQQVGERRPLTPIPALPSDDGDEEFPEQS